MKFLQLLWCHFHLQFWVDMLSQWKYLFCIPIALAMDNNVMNQWTAQTHLYHQKVGVLLWIAGHKTLECLNIELPPTPFSTLSINAI